MEEHEPAEATMPLHPPPPVNPLDLPDDNGIRRELGEEPPLVPTRQEPWFIGALARTSGDSLLDGVHQALKFSGVPKQTP